jgi:hypothetical protein
METGQPRNLIDQFSISLWIDFLDILGHVLTHSDEYSDIRYGFQRSQGNISLRYLELFRDHENLSEFMRGFRRGAYGKAQLLHFGIIIEGKGMHQRICMPPDLWDRIHVFRASNSNSSRSPRGFYEKSSRCEYKSKYVNDLFRSSGLEAAVDTICITLNESMYSDSLQNLLYRRVLKCLQRHTGIKIEVSSDDLCAIICDSVRQFVCDLKSKGTMKLANEKAMKHIMSACTFRSKISNRNVRKIIGFSRHRLAKHRKDYLFGDDEYIVDAEDMDESLSSDSEDNSSSVEGFADIALVEERGSDSEIEDSDEEPASYSTDEISDDNDDSDFSDPDFNTGDVVPMCLSASNLVGLADAKRETRCDARDLELCDIHWHAATQYNTNTNKEYLVLEPATGMYKSHRQQLQTNPGRQEYRNFLASLEYKEHLAKGGGTIGFTNFMLCKCTCIKWDKLRKCADNIIAQFKEMILAAKRIYRKKKYELVKGCPCVKHNNPLFREACESNGDSKFINFTLCAATERLEIPREASNLYTAAVRQAQVDENIADLNSKLPQDRLNHMDIRRIKKEQSSKRLKCDTTAAVQNEILTIHDRGCCLSTCQLCGVKKRLIMGDTCPLESNSEKYVSWRKY